MPVERFIVSRDDRKYECFPDLAITPSHRLVVIYRESHTHGAREPEDFCNLVWRTSDDTGRTWSPRHVLVESRRRDDVLLKWNCPRLTLLPDGRLIALCDGFRVPDDPKADRKDARISFWISSDEAESFTGPAEQNGPMGVVPDRLRVTHEGTWLLFAQFFPSQGKSCGQYVWRSADEGQTWQGPIQVAYEDRYYLCEAGTVQLDSGRLVCYMRENQGLGLPALKAFSDDDGCTWQGVYPTLHESSHRPVPGLTASGKVLTTYAHRMGGQAFGRRNLHAFLETQESAACPDRQRQDGAMLQIDHDRGILRSPDQGYTGWVNLPDGSLYCVNYIVDDAPMAHIRGYRFREEDF